MQVPCFDFHADLQCRLTGTQINTNDLALGILVRCIQSQLRHFEKLAVQEACLYPCP
jgi:hypothetical protein